VSDRRNGSDPFRLSGFLFQFCYSTRIGTVGWMPAPPKIPFTRQLGSRFLNSLRRNSAPISVEHLVASMSQSVSAIGGFPNDPGHRRRASVLRKLSFCVVCGAFATPGSPPSHTTQEILSISTQGRPLSTRTLRRIDSSLCGGYASEIRISIRKYGVFVFL